MVTCEKLSGTFTPRVRLFARNAALLTTAQNANNLTLNYPGTNTGNYSLLIDGAGLNDSDTYRLNAYGIQEDALKLCSPIVVGSALDVTSYGGLASNSLILLTATNVTAPTNLSTPVLTNQFDSLGAFGHTNLLNRGELQRFFRLRTP